MSSLTPSALSTCVRDVASFVDAAGWDAPPQLFALVPTADLLAAQPELAATLDATAELTPVAQDALPEGADGTPAELDVALAGLAWPEGVAGCALVQEVLILPPDAEAALDAELDPVAGGGESAAVHAALHHEDRREARVLAAVLRDGSSLCLLQLRPSASVGAGAAAAPELLEHPDLAPNLVAALRATFED